ncbi:MAG: glycosyltransferase family 2 protein [Deltaproteobacteria bacterium]|nr:glycosyltransferase family 2 protein [Deltaproteobacteria bacterium]
MKVSIITAAYNGAATIEDTILSVASQAYPDIEHIIIDGFSTDGTLSVIKKHEDKVARFLSEPDSGIYDAMNKGISLATGDIVGILNSDDVYYDNNCLSTVISEFQKKGVDSVFADLVYVRRDNLQKVVRYYSSANFSPPKFAFGWMPAHPTFFVRRECYEKYGKFKTDYIIAADYELLVRFLARHKITYSYIPKVLVRMRIGGISTKSLRNNWILNKEILRACAENGIKTNIVKVLSKYPVKILQLIKRPKLSADYTGFTD